VRGISLLSFFIYSPETYLAHVEQGLPTLPEHLSSLQVFSSVRADRSLAFFVMLCRSVVCPFILLTVDISDLLLFLSHINDLPKCSDIFSKTVCKWLPTLQTNQNKMEISKKTSTTQSHEQTTRECVWMQLQISTLLKS
jgi:hypothetical protein